LDSKFERTRFSNMPLVTIITIVYKGINFLEAAIQSVLNQTYDNIEYIIIDGGSTDGTLDIVRKYDDRIAFWLSEPDQGISDAFNKGIASSTGEFIGLLNADDRLSSDQIELGVKALLDSSADFVFGDLLFHDGDGRVLYRINGDPAYARTIHSKMPELCHPTVLARRKAYEQIGLFDTRYRYAMDYEWFLRLHRHGGSGRYVKDLVGHMGIGGASDRSYVNALKEVRDISVRYGRNRLIAGLLYRLRMIKGAGRRILESCLPRPVFDRIRNVFNPRYFSIKRSHH
jgi:glycosyltransferase involved in cell wall biosynthesis